MSIISLDPQATGWRDDGSESGVVRAEVVRGIDLVRVPLRDGQFTLNGSSSSATRGSWQENSDGTASGIIISVAAAATAPTTVSFPFSGRVLGLRFNPGYNSPNIGPGITDFSVMIDGVAYPASSHIMRPDADAPSNIASGEVGVLIADNLDFGPHYATIVFPPHPTINARWALFGFLLEKAAGYEPTPKMSLLGSPTVLTTATTSLHLLASGTSAKNPRAIRGAFFINSTATAVTVTLAASGADFFTVSVPANGSAQWTLPSPLGLNPNTMTIRASAASAVTATMIEEVH